MIPFPDYLYKYRDADNDLHIDALQKKYIFMASPVDFNDPFDCKIPLDFESIAENSNLQFQFASKLATTAMIANEKKLDFFEKIIQSGTLKDKDILNRLEQEQVKKLVQDMGVLSLTKESSNLLLWSHYANSHKGFCIGYDTKRLLHDLEYPTLGPVNYCNIYPIVSAADENEKITYTQLFYKSIDWYYENEYRYVKPYWSNKKCSISANTINEIYLGCMISEKNQIRILNIAKSNYPEAKIYKYQKNKFKYEIEKTTII